MDEAQNRSMAQDKRQPEPNSNPNLRPDQEPVQRVPGDQTQTGDKSAEQPESLSDELRPDQRPAVGGTNPEDDKGTAPIPRTPIGQKFPNQPGDFSESDGPDFEGYRKKAQEDFDRKVEEQREQARSQSRSQPSAPEPDMQRDQARQAEIKRQEDAARKEAERKEEDRMKMQRAASPSRSGPPKK